MRASQLLPLALFLITPELHAQVNAGDVPPGTSVATEAIELELNSMFSIDTADIHLDCDGVADLQAILVQGAPPIDAPNFCALRLLHTGLELCSDLDPYFWRPRYHDQGDPLSCTGGFDWRSDSLTVLGDLGSFTAMGPVTVDSQYVAYRSGGEVGWLLLSFDLNGGGLSQSVSFTIHQVLVQCIGLGVAEPASPTAPVLFPNPSNGQPVRVESVVPLRSIEVLDLSGKVLAQYSGPVRSIPAPAAAGSYLVRTTTLEGRRGVGRLVRY